MPRKLHGRWAARNWAFDDVHSRVDGGGVVAQKAWVAAVMAVWAVAVAVDDVNFTAAVRGLHAAVVIGTTVEQLLARASAPVLTSAVMALTATLANDQVVSASLFPLVLVAAMA